MKIQLKKPHSKLHSANVVELFFEAAEEYPSQTAIVDHGTAISYEKLAISVRQTAAFLHKKGIRPGDRVLIFIPMSIDLYRNVLAILYLGATAVFLDEWVSKSRMELCCKIAGCKAMLGVRKALMFAWFSKELRRIPIQLGPYLRQGSKQQVPLYQTNAEDTALITFTTGSTGIPKAADRTHEFLHEQFKALKKEIDPRSSDIAMPVLPIVLLMNLGAGACSVIADFPASKPEKMDASNLIGQIQDYQVERITASPFVVLRLATYAIRHKKQIPSLKKVFTGGAPVFPEDARIIQEAFPHASIHIVYGSTEAEPISSISASQLIENASLKEGLPVGNIFSDAAVRIIPISDSPIELNTTEELERLSLAIGEIGEIIVSGPHVLKSYIQNPEAIKRNKIILDKTWHRTGDAGFLDEQGKLYLTGRCKNMIQYGDKYLAPFLYEHLLQQIAGVGSATIIKSNEKLIVVVEIRPGFDRKLLVDKLRSWDLPYDEIRQIDQMPRDPRHHSKIDYEKLLGHIAVRPN